MASTPSPKALRFLVATLAGLLAGFTLFVFFGGDSDPDADAGETSTRAGATASAASAEEDSPTATTLELGDDSAMKCMVPTAKLLREQEIALEGTVNTIEAEAVTLDVKAWLRGGSTDQVILQSADPELRLALSGVDFEVGPTYLISASEGRVTMCGFSGEATPDLAMLFDRAFASG
jgi:hypothetical protein